MIVYAHINKKNRKAYIGITHHIEPDKRWLGGRGYYKNKHFADAIKKYGWDGFEHLIIVDGVSKEVACCVERGLIRKYRTNDKRFGYNITDGGEQFRHSKESIELMSKNRRGISPGPFTEEHKEKMRLNHRGGADKKKVVCVETGVIYTSINEAAHAIGKTKKMVSNCCNGVPHYNTAGGYHWKFLGEY